MYSGLVFVDFSKAFDMINHEILLKNLSSLGVKNKNLEWFRRYFNNRTIAVKNGKATSISKDRKATSISKALRRGTPQGSSLSGLLFSIYINIIPILFKN
jgi:hypothetical protein